MRYVLGIDFGGGASKATLLGEDGVIAATSTVEYRTDYPRPGWAEQDPMDWYRATRANVRTVLQKSGVTPEQVIALSLDAATHTAVLMDDEYRVLMPAIYWTDTRCTEQVAYLKQHHDALIMAQALHHPDTIWTLPQLMWVRERRPDVWSRVGKILFAKDFVRHLLTGDDVTDAIEAQGSMLFDYNRGCWSAELCALAGLDMSVLPRIVQPSDVVGHLTAEAAQELGLSEQTAVLCGTTDTVMEVFAAGAVKEGQMTLKLATAGRICVVTDRPYPNQHLINYSHVLPGLWYPGTATKSCAASYRWYRDTFGEDYEVLDAGAADVPVGADGLLFHPYLNGELTPYADPKLCGSFVGVRAGHTKAHFTRAVLEGVAMSMLDCKTALEAIGIPHEDRAVIIGGGGKSPLWRQITSDVLGIKLISRKYADSSFGSAMLAGVTMGLWSSPTAAVEACNATVCTTEPNEQNHAHYRAVFAKYKRVHDALADIYHEG